jgi:hypothetical protein
MAVTDPRLIRLVARHLDDLKGLHNALVGFILVIADWAWLGTHSTLLSMLAAVYAFMLGLLPVALYGGGTYANLGRVALSPRRTFLRRWMYLPFLVVANIQNHETLRSFPSLMWLFLSAYPAWFALDGWPYRSYHLITCVAAIYVAFGRPIAPDPTGFAWAAPRLWVFALALIATGIADHFLVVKVMRPSDEAAEEEWVP